MSDESFLRKSNIWRTPPKLLEAITTFFDGHIDFDASPLHGDVLAARSHAKKVLGCEWNGHIFCNLLNRSKETDVWTLKAMTEHRLWGNEIILLTYAHTNTEWFQRLFMIHTICFIGGHLEFFEGEGSTSYPSALIYIGERPNRFLKHFNSWGPVVGEIWTAAGMPTNTDEEEDTFACH